MILPVVESVPIFSSPALLSQDRYVVSTSHLRGVQFASDRRALLVTDGERRGRSALERLETLEDEFSELKRAVMQLQQSVLQQSEMLEVMAKRLPAPDE